MRQGGCGPGALGHPCTAASSAGPSLTSVPAMLPRTLLIFASATLGACNPVASAPLDIGELGRVIGSYAHSIMDTLESSIGNHPTRPKRLEQETVPYGGNESPGTIVVRTNE